MTRSGPYFFIKFRSDSAGSAIGFKVKFAAGGPPMDRSIYREIISSGRLSATRRTTMRRTTTRRTTTRPRTTRRITTRTTRRYSPTTTPKREIWTRHSGSSGSSYEKQMTCGQHETLDNVQSGVVISPGFGRSYPPNCDTSWTFNGVSMQLELLLYWKWHSR